MFNSDAKNFEAELQHLINHSNLTVAVAYYIVENAALNLRILLNDLSTRELYGEIEKTSTVEVGGEEGENEDAESDGTNA